MIAPLTVTIDRESVVDFSKPFLSFDVKPEKHEVQKVNTIFSFFHPLSKEIWVIFFFLYRPMFQLVLLNKSHRRRAPFNVNNSDRRLPLIFG